MIFSSIFFLCVFFPLVLFGFFATKRKYQNIVLLISSLLFYAWSEPKLVFILLFVILANFCSALIIENGQRKLGVFLSILSSVGVLSVFKYTNFAYTSIINLFTFLHLGGHWGEIPTVILPIGISFYCFQTLSYNIDVYRKVTPASRNLLDFATYVSFFPQLIAGPIVRYVDIKDQLNNRQITSSNITLGIERIIIGLLKKIVIANSCSYIVDQLFNCDSTHLSISAAWLGAICYTLQIYFDFSGYSDIAIGLARIFGITFIENFNYPYISDSIRDFWRRWHISLSTWFRDYLYIPLGGNRKGEGRTYINLFIVFLITGLWHGASWSFVFWGVWHGLFIILERLGLNNLLDKVFKPIRHIYAMLVVTVGWVFFRAENLEKAIHYVKRMFGLLPTSNEQIIYKMSTFANPNTLITLGLALIFMFPIFPYFRNKIDPYFTKKPFLLGFYYTSLLVALMFVIMNISVATYNPFIYFKF